jgi:hypothetical protein
MTLGKRIEYLRKSASALGQELEAVEVGTEMYSRRNYDIYDVLGAGLVAGIRFVSYIESNDQRGFCCSLALFFCKASIDGSTKTREGREL